jgi:hypothetical protein
MTDSKSKNLRDIASELAGEPARRNNGTSKIGGLAPALGIRPQQARAAGEPATAAMNALMRARQAGGGAVRQKYLADAQNHISSIDPSRHADLLQHLQAHVVAMGGRGGDTELAHVTPGEIVIPKRLQTPEFLKALYLGARAFGIDPARLVVGSGRNVINPRTGQPEFDDSDDDSGDTSNDNGDASNDNMEKITVTAPPLEWSPDDYYYGERLPFTEAANKNDPALAQAIISTAINRVGVRGYGKNSNTLSGVITAPKQFQGINNDNNQPWRTAQDPDRMNASDKGIFGTYSDVVHKTMNGELPDNTGGATFFFYGEPSAETLGKLSDPSNPLTQTAKIGGFTFYKPAPATKGRPTS